MSWEAYIAIGLYFGVLLLIGRLAYNKNASMNEYMLDNRKLGPFVTALSAGASDMSGWMLLGLPGALYATGLANIWIAIGLTIGAYCNYLFLAQRFRVYTEVAGNAITIPDYLESRFKDNTKILRLVSGFIILVFFTLYVSSGIIAGGKSFESFFGLPFEYGGILTLTIVVFYTFFGGFKAVCWTDAFQGTLMFLVLVAIPILAYLSLTLPDGGSVASEIKSLSPSHLDLFAGQTFLSIVGLMAWGFGYFGQPHIIVRFMAIRSSKELTSARRIGIGWMIIGLLGAVASGLLGYVYFNQQGIPLKDAETVFLRLGDALFHPFFVGIVVSAVLAAVMSTISSQLLVSSSSVTKDFILAFTKKDISVKTQVAIGRYAVVAVGIVAALIAFNSGDTVLGAVGYAWAGFGAAFGPLILASLYWKKMNALGALAGMLSGGITVILWKNLGLGSMVYEILPGIVAASISIYVVSILGNTLGTMSGEVETINDEFAQMEEKL